MFISRILQQKTDWYSDYLGDTIKDLLDTSFEIPVNYTTTVTQVTADYIARPDLLAHDIYGDEMYADILCKVNGISNPFELNEGMYLLIPDLEFMNRFVVQPAQEWHSENATGSGGETTNSVTRNNKIGKSQTTGSGGSGVNGNSSTRQGTGKPQAKLRSDRRKPNQAVLGDKRFNIDPISKIVIY